MSDIITENSVKTAEPETHLRNVDLNLLTVFDAVMQLQNITRAANMLGMSQPAVSNAVARLKIMFNDDLLLLMDFTNSTISYITDSDTKKIALNEGYQKIKSECKMNQIFIFLNINNNEYRFKLDTGFLGNIVIPYNENLKFEKDRNIAFEGEFFQTASGRTNGEEIFYENQQINLGDINVNSTLLISKSIKAQNVGINFIKGFDWIIDFYNNSFSTFDRIWRCFNFNFHNNPHFHFFY